MPSTLEAPARGTFNPPEVGIGDVVLFNNGTNGVWFPALVTRTGIGSSGPAIEVLVTSHDGGGVDGADMGAANITQFARDNVKHADDPDAMTEQYQVHVIGDNEGGYWKLTPSDERMRNRIKDIETQLKSLSRVPKNPLS